MADHWERRLKLLAYLMRRGYAQTAEAARYVGADRRKVLADLKALEEHGVPLSPHPAEDTHAPDRAWKLEPTWRMAGLEVHLFERLALLLGKEVLEPLVGPSELGLALADLEHELASVAEGVEATDQELMRRFHFVQEPSKDYSASGELVNELVQAIVHAYRVTLTYRGPSASEAKTFARVRPLTLAIYRRGLYAFVWFEDEKPRTLALDRIESIVSHADDGFDYPTRGRWDPAKLLARRFGLMASPGEAPRRVRLRFPAESRAYVYERQWMPDQAIEERADGHIDVVFEAEGRELPHRILEWGPYCEVVEPPELRREVLALARGVLARHGEPGS